MKVLKFLKKSFLKKIIVIILLISFFNIFIYSQDKQLNLNLNKVIDNNTAKKNYLNAFKKWKSKNIYSYYMKINYSSFGPISGIWEIYVENNKVIKWIVDGIENPEFLKEKISKMTMDYFFNEAKKSYNNKKNDDFVTIVDYNIDIGYVKNFMYLRNPNTNKTIPTDKTFKYEIIEFNLIK